MANWIGAPHSLVSKCTLSYIIDLLNFSFLFCVLYGKLPFRFLRNLVKVSATKLGPLSTQFKIIFHWHSKRNNNKNTVLTQFRYQLLRWFLDKTNNASTI